MTISDPRFDFLAANAATHAILGTGEAIAPTGPLPRNAGAHLVGGSAMFGEWELVGTLPDRHFPTRHLSANGRWLGVEIDDVLNVYDLEGGVRRGFSFPLPRHASLAILPDGDMVAVRTGDEVRLLLPDGEVIGRATVPRSVWHEEMSVSACGRYVRLVRWHANDELVLTVLRVPDLTTLVQRAIGFENRHGDEIVALEGDAIFFDPAGGRFLIEVIEDDSGSLYVVASDATGERAVGWLADFAYDAEDGIERAEFRTDDQVVLLFFRDGSLAEWRYASKEPATVRPQSRLWLKGEYDPSFNAVAYSGDIVVVMAERSLRLLHSGTLRTVGLPTFLEVDALLPNGMTLTRSWRGTTDVRRLRRDGVREGVVIEIDSDDGECLRVWRREGDGWRDVTAGVVWAMPAFDVARYA